MTTPGPRLSRAKSRPADHAALPERNPAAALSPPAYGIDFIDRSRSGAVLQRRWIGRWRGQRYGVLRWKNEDEDKGQRYRLADGDYKAELDFRTYWARPISDDEMDAILAQDAPSAAQSTPSGPAVREMKEEYPPSPWRQYRADNKSNKGFERNAVPRSTARIQPVLLHQTRYVAMPSIQATGLEPKRVNSDTGLNFGEANKRYTFRDAFLKAVYLETNPGPAKRMDLTAEEGGRVLLTVKVPTAFRDAYLRDSNATIVWPFDFDEVSDTVLSFARIPPEFLFLQDPETKEERCITRFPKDYDWRSVATQPKEGALKTLAEVEQDRSQREAMRARLAAPPEAKADAQQPSGEQQPSRSGSTAPQITFAQIGARLQMPSSTTDSGSSDKKDKTEDGW